jgi:hypothetical protein
VGKKRKPASAERIELLKMLGRRKYLLKKERAGSLTAQERTELKAMPPPKRGRPAEPQIGSEVDTSETAPQDDAVATEAAASEPGHGEDDAAAPPPPPRVEIAKEPPPFVAPQVAKGDWRAKYRSNVGREGICREAAGLWCGALKRLSSWIAGEGAVPILDHEAIDKMIFPPAVLVADKILPPRLEMSAEVETVALSGGLLFQGAVIRYRKSRADMKPPEPVRTRPVVVPFEQPVARPAERPAPENLRPADAAAPPPAPPPPSDDYRV